MSVRGRSFPLVIAAPSGAGKTTLARALVERHEDIIFSVSATTRPRRQRERAGRDYRFVGEAEFERMIEAGELVEWAVVHGCKYGTPRRELEEALRQDRIVVLDIDVQGARQIRELFPESVLAFILPPTAAELNRRLAGRGSEADADRRRRLGGARRELAAAVEFDYVVVNDDFERAVHALECIVTAERHRVGRTETLRSVLGDLDQELATILERST